MTARKSRQKRVMRLIRLYRKPPPPESFFSSVCAMPRLYKLSKKYTMGPMKRVLSSLVIILIAAAVVFLIGWVEFDIKPGECGVMVSKTSGVLERPLLPGSFVWRWEKLLPTNVTVHKFRMEPYRSVQSYSGSLPGSDLYAKMLDGASDFSYELELSVQLSPKAEGLVALVERNVISSQTDLEAYLENKAKVVSKSVADSLLPDLGSPASGGYLSVKALDRASLERLAADSASDLDAVSLNSVEVTKARIPDMESYTNTRELYENYKAEVQASLREKAASYADEMNESEKTVRLLEKYAELVKKYPQLKDLGTINEVSKALKGLSSAPLEEAASLMGDGAAAPDSAGAAGNAGGTAGNATGTTE